MTAAARAYSAPDRRVRAVSCARSRSRRAARRVGSMRASAGIVALMATTVHGGSVGLTPVSGRVDEVREEPAPASVVAVAQPAAAVAEALPPRVHDGDAGAVALRAKGDLDARGVCPVLAQMPGVGQPVRRLPHEHL